MNLTATLTLTDEKIFNGPCVNGVIESDEEVIEDIDA